MKVTIHTILILLAIINIPSILSGANQINSSIIIETINNEQDVNYENVSIIGVLNFTDLDNTELIENNMYQSNIQVSIRFDNCIFTDTIIGYFNDDDNLSYNAVFYEDVIFTNCIFEEEFLFKYSKFENNADFTYNHFKNRILFKYTTFTYPISFISNIFELEADFKYTNFEGSVNFSDVKFYDIAKFKYIKSKVDGDNPYTVEFEAEMVYNRMVLYQADVLHSHNVDLGMFTNNNRINQVFFM